MITFLKKKLHKHIAIGIAVPYTEEQLQDHYSKQTDFVCSLERLFQTDSLDDLWAQYKKTADSVKEKLDRAKTMGVTIYPQMSSRDIMDMQRNDICILIAHGFENGSEIELTDGAFAPNEISQLFSPDYNGIVDISSCYSSALMSILKN